VPRKRREKYPPYPDSGWDYAVIHAAKMQLEKPNKFICIYCHGQAVKEKDIPHKDDCPAKEK
jgi:hypothetical protein